MTFKYFLIEEGQQYQTDWGDKLRLELYSVLMRFSITEISMEPHQRQGGGEGGDGGGGGGGGESARSRSQF